MLCPHCLQLRTVGSAAAPAKSVTNNTRRTTLLRRARGLGSASGVLLPARSCRPGWTAAGRCRTRRSTRERAFVCERGQAQELELSGLLREGQLAARWSTASFLRRHGGLGGRERGQQPEEGGARRKREWTAAAVTWRGATTERCAAKGTAFGGRKRAQVQISTGGGGGGGGTCEQDAAQCTKGCDAERTETRFQIQTCRGGSFLGELPPRKSEKRSEAGGRREPAASCSSS